MKKQVPYYAVVLYAIVSFIVINVIVAYMMLFNYREHLINEISVNIDEYEEVDLSHVCDMIGCTEISSKSVLYQNINYGSSNRSKLVKLAYNSDSVSGVKVMSDVFLTGDYKMIFIVGIKLIDGYVTVKVEKVFSFASAYYILLVVFLSGNALFLLFNVLSYRKAHARKYIELKHDSYSKSMILITENIHHELNTPLSIINSKVAKLKGKIDGIIDGKLTKEQCDVDSHHRDFEIITGSLTQIGDLLEKMRPFKDAKKENQRTLGNVIKTSCDMMSVSQHDKFDYWIAEELYLYKAKNIRNGEITAIILNFIKNSVDANACNIQFRFIVVNGKKLSLYVSDDGNGIPDYVKCSIFKEDKSTKSEDRGSGLYTNKFLLDEAGGSVKLKYSSINGTIFEITLEVEKI